MLIPPNGLTVIEVNNINSAGYYAVDVQKRVMALEEMVAYPISSDDLNIGGAGQI